MSAPEFDELLSAYLDNEVTTEERAIVEQRLERSPATRETLDELSDVSEVVKSLPRVAAPEILVSRVMERVQTAVPAQPAVAAAVPPDAGFFRHLRHRRNRNTALIAAACLVVAVVLLRRPAGRDEDRHLASNADFAPAAASASPKSGPISTPSTLTTEVASTESTERLSTTNEAADRLSTSNQETLKELVATRKGQVAPGELFRTLDTNSGVISVRVFQVTDVRAFAGTTQALFTRNGIDLAEIEVSTEPDAKRDAADRYDGGVPVFFVEADEQQLDQALNELENDPAVKDIANYGTLSEIESLQAADAVDSPALAGVDAKAVDPKSALPLPAKPADVEETVAPKAPSRAVELATQPPGKSESDHQKDQAPPKEGPAEPPAPASVSDPRSESTTLADNAKPSDATEQKQSFTNGYQIALPAEEAQKLMVQVQNVAQQEAGKQKLNNRSSRYGNRGNQLQQRSTLEQSKPGRVLIILQGGTQPADALSAPSQTPP
jgi:hypothetical protein